MKADDAEAAEVIYLDAYNKNETDAKFVEKVTGKSLISDDEIARLAEVDNYNDEEVRGLIGDNAKAIEDLETYVGTIPADEKYADITNVIGYVNKKAEETLAAAQGGSSETAASVKQQLDNYKSENNTRVKAVEDDIAAIKDAENGILKQAQNYADGVQTALETEIAKKVDKVEGKSLIDDSEIARLATLANYDDTQVKADIAKKADAETMTTELGKKVDKVAGYSLVSDTEIERLSKVDNYNDTVLAGRVTTAEGKITSLETESAKHALKTEVEAVDKKFENYKTAEAQKVIDDEQDRRLGVIEGDYLKAADITNFETKDNVKKVADDLAAEIKNRSDADAGFETRIAALEGNFGDGEGTVEAQIAAAVKVEEDARKAAVKGVQDEVDAVKGRMDTAEGKIATLETESAKHAVKTEVEAALALKADKSVVDAMYTNEQIDAAILVETNRAKGVEEGLQTQINTIMSNPDAEGAINSINEFSAYINEHKPVAEAFRTDINKNKEDIAVNAKAISDEASRADTAEKALAGRLDVLEAIDHDAYVDADAALKTELIGDLLDDSYVVNTIYGAKKYAKFYTDTAQQNLEERLTGVLDVLVVKKAESADVATKATQDADGNVISTTYAKKATTLAGYGIANAYNKDETDAAVQGAKDYADGLDNAMDERVGLLETIIAVDSDPANLATPPIVYCDGDIHIRGVGLYIEGDNGAEEVATKETTLAGYGIGDAYTKKEVEALLTWGSF